MAALPCERGAGWRWPRLARMGVGWSSAQHCNTPAGLVLLAGVGDVVATLRDHLVAALVVALKVPLSFPRANRAACHVIPAP